MIPVSRPPRRATMVALLAALLTAGAPVGAQTDIEVPESPVPNTVPREPSGADGKWKVVMVNPFTGANDYMRIRDNAINAAARQEPIASTIDFQLVNTETSDEALNQALENALSQDADAIMFMAVSDTGSNEIVERACEQGVVVFTYDNPATAQACDRILFFKFRDYMTQAGRWLGQIMECEGEIIADRGLQGILLAEDIYNGWVDGLSQQCGDAWGTGIRIVGEYYSEYSDTKVEGLVAPLLAANPNVKAVLSQAYCQGIVDTFDAAGAPPPIMSCSGASNSTFEACLTEGAHCFITGNSPLGSNWVLDRIHDILVNGDESLPYFNEWQMTFASTDPDIDLGEPARDVKKVEEGVNYLPDQPPSFYPYFAWEGLYYQPTLEEVTQGL